MQKTFFHKFALVALGCMAALLLFEAGLWLADAPRFYAAHEKTRQFKVEEAPDGRFYYTNLPSAAIRFVYDSDPRGYFGPGNAVVHSTNARGFRGDTFPDAKPKGVFRIAFLGDSFTFGEGVRRKDTFPEQVARLLTARCGGTGRIFEARNYGVGGYNIFDAAYLFEHHVLQAQPDAVVLGLVPNDAEPSLIRVDLASGTFRTRDRESVVPEFAGDPLPPDLLFFRLRTARLAWLALARARAAERLKAHYKALYAPENEDWNTNRESLSRLAALCAEKRIPLLIVLFPVLVDLDGGYPFDAIHAAIKEAALAKALPHVRFLDLLPLFSGGKASALWVHPSDQHPNEAAHKIAAQAMFDALVSFAAPCPNTR